jgi:hypothetical protein
VAARIIAKTGWSASHWAPRIFAKDRKDTFPQDFPATGSPAARNSLTFRAPRMGIGSGRMPGKYKLNAANIWLY